METDHHALVIGAGYAGVKHAEALDELGIAFTGPLSARRVMEDPRALEDPGVDIVHVCASNDLHVALAGRALSGPVNGMPSSSSASACLTPA